MRRVLPVAVIASCYAPNPPAGASCADGAACPAGLVCSPASQTCELVAVDAAGEVDTSPDAFAFRRRLAIRNLANAALPAGFTIQLPLPQLAQLVADGKLRPDLADLRIIGDVSGERHRIVDPPGGPAAPAVSFALAAPLPAGESTSEYALYYGAPMAGAPPADGARVFAVFDDFTAGISDRWLVNDAPITSGGRLVLRAGATDALTTDPATDDIPVTSSMELVARVPDPTSDPTSHPDGTFFYWFGYQRAGDFRATDPWVLWIARGKGSVRAEQKSPVGCEMDCASADQMQSTGFRHYAIERTSVRTRFSMDGAVVFTADVVNTNDYGIMLRNFMATSALEIDWVRARARATPDPSIVVGAEEPP
jgi:hypothetical protein